MRSFVALAHVEPGFNPRNALTMNVSLSFPRLIGARKYAAYMQQMMEKLAQLPGVTAAGASSDLPWTGADDNVSIQIEGRPQVANERRHARYHTVTPNYFRAIGVPLVAGRWLTAADHFDAPKVLLINQSLALEYWPDAAAALGKKINVFGPWLEIVGVAGDIKDGPADSRAQAALYLPFLQQPSFTTFAVLRTQSDPTALTAAARRTVEAMGADASVQEVHTLEQVAGAAISEQRFTLLLSAVFAGVALLLAAVGIYAVMAYTVSQRSQEIGVRVALGAQGRDLLALIVRNGLALTLPGIAIGIGLALALGRVLARLLFAVSANDLATYAAVAALLTVVALAAAVAPARRALRVDPMDVLRHE
jgi:putative ABC transport system permease protein